MKPPMNQPLHRFMLTFQAVFRGPQGQGGMKTVNTVISRSKKTLPLAMIKKAQDGLAMQLGMFGIQADDIIDVAFLSSSYLGLMTEKEFTDGLSDQEAASASLSEEGGDETPSEIGDNPLSIN